MKILIIYVFLCHLFVPSLLTQGTNFRLSTKVKPSVYSLTIQPHFDEDTFSGQVSINVKVDQIINQIILHSRNLSILDLYIDNRKDNYSVTFDEDLELMKISYQNDKTFSPGNHVIFINYTGSLLGQYGFFKAQSSNNDGTVSQLLAVTQFQPTYARRAFPCFDEPSFKARFKLTIITPNSTYLALSNMREITRFLTSKGMIFKFETTCIMSNYLLAFAVTQYTNNELIMDYQGRELPIRSFSLNMSGNVGISIDTIAKSVDFFSDYTGIPYPLSKIDAIEYDRYDDVTATEHWGLITTKSGILSDSSKIYGFTRILVIMAHEIAHFWFGNLVTNNWWDDIWLHESFAVFMSLKAEDFIKKSTVAGNYLRNYLKAIYRIDQEARIGMPIVNFLEKPSNIGTHFSHITYYKGAAVLKMSEQVLGEDKFKLAIRNFLVKFAYKTTTTNDLITFLENVAPQSHLRSFLESYLYQSRFPLIFADENEQTNEYILSQKSCDFSSEIPTSSQFGQKWTLPLTYISNIDKDAKNIWFHKEMDNLRIPKRDGQHWIKLDQGKVGYYYTIYSQKLWTKFLNHSNELRISERFLLSTEATDLYLLGLVPCGVALNYFNFLFKDDDKRIPLSDIWNFYYHSQNYFEDEEAFQILTNYLNYILKKSNRPPKFLFTNKIQISSRTKIKSTTEVHKEIENCSKWIKQNLYEYSGSLNKTLV